MILEDQYKQAQNELNEKSENLKNVRPATAKVKKDTQLIKVLENQLDKNLKSYNDLQSGNKSLRQQIDVMRKEMKNQNRVNTGYGKDIKVANEKAKKLNTTTYQGQRVSEETNNQILALKAKHENEKLRFETKIKDLQDKLKERDDTDMEKTKTRGMGTVVNDTTTADAGEFSNPVALLKLRLQKWVNNNKEKKNLMDMYIRNVNIIEDAFAQIKQQTGIFSTEEIVTTFIKAEEQNYSLYNYVNMLNSDIDMIEEQNKNIESEIQRHEELGEMTEKEKGQCRDRLKKEIEESQAQMAEKETQIKNIEHQMACTK